MKAPPVRRIRWAEAFRIISARHPPIEVFERVAPPEDWDELIGIEELTNPRVRQSVGEVGRVDPSQRVFGPGASWVMGAFTHVGNPSRFTDGSYGVYYAARHLLTAVFETSFHYGRFLARTNEAAGTELQLRILRSRDVQGRFPDIRSGYRSLHDPDDYGPSQRFGAEVRAKGARGLVYDSVRRPGFACIAFFDPSAVPLPESGGFVRYRFDGERISDWIRLGADEAWRPL